MKKILLAIGFFIALTTEAQVVNKFRDSSVFFKGVRFDSTLVFKGLKSGSSADTNVVVVSSTGKVSKVSKSVFLGDLPIYSISDSNTVINYDVLNSQNTPPVSPSTGDVYLVGTVPTGAWIGHAKDIAEWNGSAWVFTDGVQGDFLYNATNALTYIFRSGNWVQTTGIPALHNGNTISSGLKIGTNNARSLTFETNNVNRGRFDSIGRFHIYNLPASSTPDTLVTMSDLNGKLTKQGKSTFLSGVGGGGSSDSIYYFRTFAQAKSEMQSHSLKSGASYQLTDFATVYDQPDYNADGSPKDSVTTKTGSIEHLVFLATSESTFADEVSSIEYIYDKIKFEWNYTATEIMGAPAKGRIIERITNSFNRTDFDSRAVLFKRYESAPSSGEFSSCFDNGNAFTEYPVFEANSTLEVTIGDYYLTSTLFGGFSLPNIVMKTGSGLAGTFFAQMEVKSGCYNITWLNGANNNIIGTGTNNCLFKGIFVYNYIGFNATNLIVNGNFANNYLGENWLNVTFNGYAEYNSFWDRLENCTFGDTVVGVIQYGLTSNSTFGNSFTYAVLYGTNEGLTVGNSNLKLKFWDANSLVIGNNNSSIDFASTTSITVSNDINGIKNVVFSSGINGFLWSNYINPTTHPEMYNTYPKTVFLGSNGSAYSRYFDGTNDVNTIIN